MDKLKLALIGCGARGGVLFDGVLKERDDAVCAAVCDPYEDRRANMAGKMERAYGERPREYEQYRACLDSGAFDAAVVATPWDSHLEIALYAMERGIPVGVEVGGAYSLQALWELVRCFERTGTPVMLLENACFGRLELLALNMKRLGLLGEIVHCEGGYCHDLRRQIAYGRENRHYRFIQYKSRNTDNYPTHGLGPIAKILGINRGNRFLSLHASASKAAGMEAYAAGRSIESLKDVRFRQADVVTCAIVCQNGELINLTLDTTLPRYYTRRLYVRGTKGLISEENRSVFLEDEHGEKEDWSPYFNNVGRYYEQYDHPLWKGYTPKGGHGGMDWLVMDAFLSAVRDKKPMPIDAYDLAAWMSVSVLAEQSLSTGATVYFPDFTDGKWCVRPSGEHAEGL